MDSLQLRKRIRFAKGLSLKLSKRSLGAILVSIFLLLSLFVQPSKATDYSCQYSPQKLTEDPIWTTSSAKDLKFIVSWAFKDPENCIIGMYGNDEALGRTDFYWKYASSGRYNFPAVWNVTKSGEMTLVSAETEFPIPLLQSLPNRNLDGYGSDLMQEKQDYSVQTFIKTRQDSRFSSTIVDGKYGLASLWGNWFSKNQGIFPDQCRPISPQNDMTKLNAKVSWKILNPGPKPTVEISIQEDSNCIFLVHAGPLARSLGLNTFDSSKQKSLAERPFWSGEAPPYFNQILSKPNQLVQVAIGDFTRKALGYGGEDSDTDIVETLPSEILSHSDSVIRDGQSVKVATTIDLTNISSASSKVVTVYSGFYWWYSKNSSYTSAGWRINYSGDSWTARYSSGGSLPGGVFMGYTARAVKIPIVDLLNSAAEKAAAEKAALDKAAADKASAEKAVLRKVAADKASAELADLIAQQNAIAAKVVQGKKTTVTCLKGKASKTVTAVKPVCPAGYKKK